MWALKEGLTFPWGPGNFFEILLSRGHHCPSLTHISSVRHITAFLWLKTLDITSALCLGIILDSKITNRKHKSIKDVALHRW